MTLPTHRQALWDIATKKRRGGFLSWLLLSWFAGWMGSDAIQAYFPAPPPSVGFTLQGVYEQKKLTRERYDLDHPWEIKLSNEDRERWSRILATAMERANRDLGRNE